MAGIHSTIFARLYGGRSLPIAVVYCLGLMLPVLGDGIGSRAFELSQTHRHGWFDGQRNPAGEWCCGAGDCALMSPGSVSATARGFVLHGVGTISQGDMSRYERYDEIVPEREALPSQDGSYWRCKRPDGTRRCFFAPPPSI